MDHHRIHFIGNPWPEGHAVKTFEWKARVLDGDIWFDLHLETADYDAEHEAEDDETEDRPSWESPIVWNNYHACTLSSCHWDQRGFATGLGSELSLDALDGLELVVDSPPPEDFEDNAFHIYLLGHDAVAEHRIRFTRTAGTDRFDIHWTGKIALAYAGDDEYKHSFVASLKGVPAPSLSRPSRA